MKLTEVADEYILKQDVIHTIMGQPPDVHYPSWYAAQIEAIPAADVVPVVHGRWLPQKENHEFKEAWMKCSVCGYPVSRWTGNTNFCSSCGAKMRGVQDE